MSHCVLWVSGFTDRSKAAILKLFFIAWFCSGSPKTFIWYLMGLLYTILRGDHSLVEEAAGRIVADSLCEYILWIRVFFFLFVLFLRAVIFDCGTPWKAFNIWAPWRENLSSGFATSCDLNRHAQLMRLAGVLKFRLQQVEILYYSGSEQQKYWSDCVNA